MTVQAHKSHQGAFPAEIEAAADIAQLPDPLPIDYVPRNDTEMLACLKDPFWRLCSGQLYKIMTKDEEHQEGAVIPFKPNLVQRMFLADLHTRNVILKARQMGFCLDCETRVLTADLQWVRIDTLQPGDEVIGVDEHVPGGRGAARKMRTATVQACKKVRRYGYRVQFADGRAVVCTDQHPWLARSGVKRQPFWRAMDRKAPNAERNLTVGHQVRSICVPWEAGQFEDGWFGGMIDGEGSLSLPSRSGASVCVSQRPGPVWDRMVSYAQDRQYHYRIEHDEGQRESKHGTTPVPKLVFSRTNELFRLIGETRPTRGLQRSFRFWEGKEMPGKRNMDNAAWNEIVSIEPVGEVDMIALETSTGTFIAEGMVSHNTTVIVISFTDHAIFNDNQRCGIIAQSLPHAESFFRDKAKFAYDNLPQIVKDLYPIQTSNTSEILFKNNSSIRVATSMRSGTIHRLHVSEMGKIAAEHPGKAVEIVTGSLAAVPASGIASIESTAEGQEGEFHKIATRAERRALDPRPLAPKEMKFHFFAWHDLPEYQTDPRHVRIAPEWHDYFDQVEIERNKRLILPQRAWYIMTLENEQNGDTEKMWREYPSTPAECWQQSTQGTWYAPQIAAARAQGRICQIPHVNNVPVHTFWDIGAGDGTGIWAMQDVGTRHRFIRYFEDWAQGYGHFVRLLRETGWNFGVHYLPHDANHERQMENRVASPLMLLQEIAPDWNFQIVPRVDHITNGIQMVRDKFPEAWFNVDGSGADCEAGLKHVELYKKKWNARLGVFSDEPEKLDGHSEAADALRQWAQGYDPALFSGATRPKRRRQGGALTV
jgi:hypothetical protein